MEKERRQISWFLGRLAIAGAAALGCYVLFGLVGMDCLFKSATGFPCLTCGMSRAWISVFSLDLAGAFFWHPLFWAIPAIALLLIFGGLRGRSVFWLLAGTLILFGVIYLLRMLALFPHTPPMDYYLDGFLPRLLRRFF